MNGNFVSVMTVGSMLARSHKHLVFDMFDIVEWCGEAIKNIGNFDSFKHYIPEHDPECHLKIKNRQALLPCNVYRLLGVYHRKSSMNATDFIRDDAYLRFTKHHDDWGYDDDENCGWQDRRITIDYIGVRLDKEGYPMIDEVALQACYWYCVKMLSLENYTMGKISENVWNTIDTEYGKYVMKAKSSFKNTTRNDMDEIAMILYNAVPKIRLPRNMT